MGLLEAAIEAHGGAEPWSHVGEVVVRARCGGLALVSKAPRSAFERIEIRVSTREPWAAVPDWPQPGWRGLFTPERTWVENPGGEVVRELPDPRSAFHGALTVRWDDLHLLYFAGYAWWGYVNQPYLFARPGFATRELDERRLLVTFPPGVPAHSRRQVFWFDDELRIVRNDYTAEVIGRWARGRHFSSEHRRFEGFLFPTRRRVVPRRLPRPVLVSLDVEGVDVVSGAPAR